MLLKFPFTYVRVEHLGLLFYPIVSLDIQTIYGWKSFDFLVDTGADTTTLPSTILPYLGLKIENLQASKVFGVGGTEIKTYEAKIPIKIGNQVIKASASITNDHGTPFLLGRKDIFEEKFSLEIDSKSKLTILKENVNV